MRVASVQMAATIGAVDENINKALQLSQEAVQAGAQVICLPELFHCGYFPHRGSEDRKFFALAEELTGPTTQTFKKFAREHDVHVVLPLFEKQMPGVFYNSVLLIPPDDTNIEVYRKIHVPWSTTGWEKFYFRPGDKLEAFKIGDIPVGLQLCHDRIFPEVSRSLALQGALVLFIPAGAPTETGEGWQSVLRARAIENAVFVIGSNLTGKAHETGHSFAGQSMIVSPAGNELARLDREEGIAVADLDFELVHMRREALGLYRDLRPDLYRVADIPGDGGCSRRGEN